MKKSYDRILYEVIQKAFRNIKEIKDNPKKPYKLKKTELDTLDEQIAKRLEAESKLSEAKS